MSHHAEHNETVESRVKSIIVENLDVDAADIKDESSFIDDLGADSLDAVELMMAFEEAFDLEIPDNDAEKIQTFGDAVVYIKEKLGEPV